MNDRSEARAAPGRPEKVSPYRSIARASAWAIAMRWVVRAIGLVSVMIMARLLTPADFGIVAMGSLLIGVLAEFFEGGTSVVLMRQPVVTRAHCDTAWTVQFVLGIFVATVLVLLAHPVAWYFQEARLPPIVYLLALSAIISGAENVGMVLARRELDFSLDFRFSVYKRLAVFAVTVGLGVLWRDYWALIVGRVVGSLIEVLLSFRMHPYRPRFSLQEAAAYWQYCSYAVPANIVRSVRLKLDSFVVGRIGGSGGLGTYSVAAELANMLTQEILGPLARAMLPNYAALLHDRQRLVEVYLFMLSATTLVVTPLALGLIGAARETVLVVLGERWLASVPLLKWLAIAGVARGVSMLLSGNVLVVMGRERLVALATWAGLLINVPIITAGAWLAGVYGVACGTAVAAVLLLPVTVAVVSRGVGISVPEILRPLWPAACAGMAMIGSMMLLPLGSVDAPLVLLLVRGAVGAAVYVFVIGALWWLRGSPPGAEKALVEFVIRGGSAKAGSDGSR